MESADEDDCNFWWSVELEAAGDGAEETLLTVADLSGSVGAELLETDESGVTVLRSVYLASRDISHWLAVLDALKKDFPSARVRSHAKLENRPWHTEHLGSFPPLAVGAGLVVSAPWHKGNEESLLSGRRIIIYIYPSSAFGTGYHESTQIALTFVERFIKAGDVILDMGTGSGILFIAGLKLGAARAVARDIDPVAVTEAKRNMEFNAIPAEACDLQVGDLFEEFDGIEVQAKVNLLTSNILLSPNIELLDGLKNVLEPSGVAIFSGMTTAERFVFLPALSEAGLSILAELTINDWWGCAANWDSSERSGA